MTNCITIYSKSVLVFKTIALKFDNQKIFFGSLVSRPHICLIWEGNCRWRYIDHQMEQLNLN